MTIFKDNKKFACQQCIRGHRVDKCVHGDRPLLHVKNKGRPIKQCSQCRLLRITRNKHLKCTCDPQNSDPMSATPQEDSDSGTMEVEEMRAGENAESADQDFWSMSSQSLANVQGDTDQSNSGMLNAMQDDLASFVGFDSEATFHEMYEFAPFSSWDSYHLDITEEQTGGFLVAQEHQNQSSIQQSSTTSTTTAAQHSNTAYPRSASNHHNITSSNKQKQ